MFSIIIPTLNEEKYISKLLTSLSKQDYQNFEVIVVDANSSDKTKAQADHYSKALNLNLRFIQTKIKNTSKQRNLGAKTALGDKFVFIDADIILPKKDFLRKINKLLKSHPSVSVPVKVIPKEANKRDKIISNYLNSMMRILNSLGIANGRGAMIGVRAKEFHKIKGYNENITVAEDVDLFRRMKKFGKQGVMKEAVYESPRRYRKMGYIRIINSWIFNGIWSFIFKRSITKEWKPIR